VAIKQANKEKEGKTKTKKEEHAKREQEGSIQEASKIKRQRCEYAVLPKY